MNSLARKVRRTSEQADSDATDVALAVAGDTRAFERLYSRHVARINALAEWMLGTTDTEDALQEIFIRVWEKLETFRGESAFGTWLHRLGTNVLLRRRETTRLTEQRHVSGDDVWLQIPGRRGGPELWTDIEAAVGRLPQRARDVFVLHDVEGYKHEEIAEMLGVTPGTSRSQLHHARMTLRRHLG